MKKYIQEIFDRMEKEYGRDLTCYLNHDDAWQLLVATIMSAQCTDARVNEVTKVLFKRYPTVADLASADLLELEDIIHSVGFYHNKAKNIIGCSRALCDRFGGEVPSDIESLTSLPGVGRKTANVIRGNIFREPSVVVDTHVLRISNKLGLVDTSDPVKAEFDLMKVVDRDYWLYINHWFIALGRTICKAPRPKCSECYLKDICPTFKKEA
ncbi:MAG: endonuclease III [Lachnospiraceae bacterium]|nr:endonuclease III [Lachnospiraceae bacterium]MBR5761023.1 endonuclease III [Lachnospiraceae bacterium]MBR5992621.1 endonuclease III [Lachnospiraceae bacterium]MCR4679446.1 endonuclease III [Lachnospiraceae bacterium]